MIDPIYQRNTYFSTPNPRHAMFLCAKVRIQFTEDLKYLILVGPFVILTPSTAKARRNPSLERDQYFAIASLS